MTKNLEATIIDGKKFRWGEKTYIMGVINMTPDSFSGDGLGQNVESAVERAVMMQNEGADIIDVGGESTRPPGNAYGRGAEPVSLEEELRRVLPVIRRLKEAITIPVSIDTYKSEVARQAISAGASLVNDVWGLKRDSELAAVAAHAGVPIIVVHNQEGHEYSDLFVEIIASLERSLESAMDAGVPRERIIADPGIGFGKTAAHNLEIIRRLDEFKMKMNLPVLIGTSRKAFIGSILGGLAPDERMEGTAATVALAIAKGADMVRVHEVKQMSRVCRMADAVVRHQDGNRIRRETAER